MNAFIIDDRLTAMNALQTMLSTYCPEVVVVGTAASYAEAVDKLSVAANAVDIIFCDVDLGNETTGFDVLDRIQNYGGSVVFVSAHPEFALRAFQYDANNYLTKPVSPKELMRAVERAKKWQKAMDADTHTAQTNTVHSISVYISGRWVIIPCDQIVYIKSHQNYSHIYVKDQEKAYISSYGLRYFEEKLQPCPSFVRVQKSYVINQQYLISISRQDSSLELAGKVTIPVGGGVYRNIMSKLLGK